MKMIFEVSYIGGEKAVVTAHPRSLVTFERVHKKTLSQTAGITELMWVAWHASGSPDTFDAWVERVDDVEVVEDAPFDQPPSGMPSE